MRRLLPMLVGTAVVLGGCSSGNGTLPEASPSTSSVTTSTTTTSVTPTTTTSSSTTAPSASTQGAASPAEAIEAWLSGQGYPYSGTCADANLQADAGKWCSTLSKDQGDEQTYRVGRVFSQYKYLLELKKSGSTWSVTDVEEISVGP